MPCVFLCLIVMHSLFAVLSAFSLLDILCTKCSKSSYVDYVCVCCVFCCPSLSKINVNAIVGKQRHYLIICACISVFVFIFVARILYVNFAPIILSCLFFYIFMYLYKNIVVLIAVS